MLSMDAHSPVPELHPFPPNTNILLVISDLAQPAPCLFSKDTDVTQDKNKEKKGGAGTWGMASRVPEKS